MLAEGRLEDVGGQLVAPSSTIGRNKEGDEDEDGGFDHSCILKKSG